MRDADCEHAWVGFLFPFSLIFLAIRYTPWWIWMLVWTGIGIFNVHGCITGG